MIDLSCYRGYEIRVPIFSLFLVGCEFIKPNVLISHHHSLISLAKKVSPSRCYTIDEFTDLPSFTSVDFLTFRNQYIIDYYYAMKSGTITPLPTLAEMDKVYSEQTGIPIPTYPHKSCISLRIEDQLPNSYGYMKLINPEADVNMLAKGWISTYAFDEWSINVITRALDILVEGEQADYYDGSRFYGAEWVWPDYGESSLIPLWDFIRNGYVNYYVYGSEYFL